MKDLCDTTIQRRMLVGGMVFLLLGVGGCTRTPCGTAPAEPAPSGPALFRDVASIAGVSFAYHNGEEAGQYTLLEALGGGCAVLDFDGDGRLDLFLPGGGSFTGKDKTQITGLPCKLYRNVSPPPGSAGARLRFEDVTTAAGLDRIAFYTHGAAVGDYDNDGWPDLLVTGWGKLALFHNEPIDPAHPDHGRRFVEVTQQAQLPLVTWTTGAAWGDLDGDGYADLYVCQYVDWSFEHNHPTHCTLDGKKRDICAPRLFNGLDHRLFRNRGDGTFADVSKAAGLRVARTEAEYQQLDWLDTRARQRLRRSITEGQAKVGAGLGVLLVDVNGDGRPDLYITNDMKENFLYLNRTKESGKIQLEERGLETGTALSGVGTVNAGMGVDAADYDGSGRPSLWVTNYAGEVNALYRNECMGKRESFEYASNQTGIAAGGQKTVGWGTGFLDLDHHGSEDLFLTAGDVFLHSPTIPRAQKPVLYRNRGGSFSDISAQGGPYFTTGHNGRGVALADLDNDGRIDLVVSHLNAPVAILHNEADTKGNHWLGIGLEGAGRRDVVGARIIVEAGGRTQTRFLKGGGSYLSSSDRRHVFGLGSADHVDCLRVVWPSGQQQEWRGLAVDRYWRLGEGRQEPLPLSPGQAPPTTTASVGDDFHRE